VESVILHNHDSYRRHTVVVIWSRNAPIDKCIPASLGSKQRE